MNISIKSVPKEIVKRLILAFHSHKFNWISYIKFRRKNPEIAIYVSPKNILDSIISTHPAWKFGFAKALMKKEQNFFFAKDLGKLFDKKLFWFVNKYLDKHNFRNYSASRMKHI